MTNLKVNAIRRREQDILDRLENVKRLIEMRTTIRTVTGAEWYGAYHHTDRDGKEFGQCLRDDLNEQIQLQLLSVVALCRGDNPDVGEPESMLEWTDFGEDEFYETWEKCLRWNA